MLLASIIHPAKGKAIKLYSINSLHVHKHSLQYEQEWEGGA